MPAADLQAEARRRRDGVARLLDVFGHSCAVEGAQVCFARDYDPKQKAGGIEWCCRAATRRFFLAQLTYSNGLHPSTRCTRQSDSSRRLAAWTGRLSLVFCRGRGLVDLKTGVRDSWEQPVIQHLHASHRYTTNRFRAGDVA